MKNKLKVRLELSSLASGNISGVGSYTRELATALSRHDKIQLSLFYFNFLNRQPTPDLYTNSIQAQASMLMPLRIYAKLQSYGLAWPFDMFKKRVDLTIFPNYATWPTSKSRYSATTVHDLTYIYYPNTVEPKNLEHLKRVVPNTVERADFILTVSETVKKEIINELGVEKERIIVTYNTADDKFYENKSADEIDKVKRKYGIPTNKYIYFIGNFEPRKNLAILIRAYRLLPNSIKDQYSLVLAGSKGWNSTEAENELEKAIGAKENVIHIGYVGQRDSPALYQGASLFVMPSIYEGFGIPVLEAMASKTAVACSDIEVLRETAANAAVYFNPNNVNSISETINNIINDSDTRKKLINKGLVNLRRFSWSDNIDRIVSTIDKASSL